MSAFAPAVGSANPFPGLRPFREDEQHLFFGREAQVDRLVDKLAAHRFLGVVGTSGSGKSSLVNCGLKPALRRGLLAAAGTSWRMVQFRPGANPNHALACALIDEGSVIPQVGTAKPRPDLIEASLGLSGFGLVELVRNAELEPGTNLLLVVDQFEELFRYRSVSAPAGYGQSAEATRFVRMLLDSASQKEVPIYVVITMRSDFLGDCAQFDGLPEAISEGQYLVPRMTRDERRAAIEGPIRIANCTISTALLTRLVNDVGDNPDQLSILQHAMNRTWAHWRHDGGAHGPITIADYEAVGGMEMALDRHAEKAFGELATDRQRFLCERVFKALTDRGTDPRGIRRPTKMSNLCEIVGASHAEVLEVLAPFRKPSRSFLVPGECDTIEPESVIDISHESLMRVWVKLNVWADEEADASREYRRLADRAEDHALQKVGLMQDPDLQTTLGFRAQQVPTAAWAELYGGKFDQSMQYLDASEQQRTLDKAEKELERRWETYFQPPILALAALGFLGVLFKYEKTFMPSHADQSVTKFGEDIFRYGPKVGALILGFGVACMGVLRAGRSLHRTIALPLIVRAMHGHVAIAAKQVAPSAMAMLAPQQYSPAWRRLLASVIDFIMAIVCLVLGVIVGLIVGRGDTQSTLYTTISVTFWIIFIWLYHMMGESSHRRATLGMRLAGIYVTDLQGRRISSGTVAVRQVVKFFTLTLYAVPLVIWAVAYVIARRYHPEKTFVRCRQWPHDIVCKTVVLVGKSPELAAMAGLNAVPGRADNVRLAASS